MKIYIVIKKFIDLEDSRYEYKVGDIYPHSGRGIGEIDSNRIEELSTEKNKTKTQLIKEVEVEASQVLEYKNSLETDTNEIDVETKETEAIESENGDNNNDMETEETEEIISDEDSDIETEKKEKGRKNGRKTN